MESQLRDQGAIDKFDQVLEEIPRVREDLGFIPLVTPTSQIVGTQAVLNVLTGERYKSISKETQGVLKGEYGATPSAVNPVLQEQVLEGAQPITCRPADLLEPELAKLSKELVSLASEKNIKLTQGEGQIDDVLTYALFPQIGLKFLENRGNPAAFEPKPGKPEPIKNDAGEEVYTVKLDGQSYTVTVSNGGDITGIAPVGGTPAVSTGGVTAAAGGGDPVPAPLAGNIVKLLVKPGDIVEAGETVLVLEAMKMETNVASPKSGTITGIEVKEGDAVAVGDSLMTIA